MVGNELVVGAPGSSLSGPGDGVVYVFDANDESTTFGDLLATLTIPDAGASSDAQFGAAVGTTNTNIVIGAPGKDGGTGEVYEFEGDTTQSNFGDLLLRHPESRRRSPAPDFGAAVAGDGNDVIVGAPTVEPRRRDRAASTCSTARPATRSRRSPTRDASTTTGFGSAVASVGSEHPDRVAGRQHGGRGGAAFLYDPSGVASLTTFVQPDGGGGNFGASVAGTREHGIDRRAGGQPGHERRRRRLPLRRRSGEPDLRPGDRRRARAHAHFGRCASGPRSASTTGPVGARGAAGSGAEAVDLYQPAATISLSSATTYATRLVRLGDRERHVHGRQPVGRSHGHDRLGRWIPGDRRRPPGRVLRLLRPARLHDRPGLRVYTIGVTLSDPTARPPSRRRRSPSATRPRNSPRPAWCSRRPASTRAARSPSAGRSSAPAGPTPTRSRSTGATAPQPTTIVLAPGQDTFSTTHTYLNNPAGVASENYTIVGSVTNENDQVGYASASVTVNKVAPQFTAADLSLSETTANEGDTITLNGQFTDPDAVSSYTVTIDWGDGSTPTVLSELARPGRPVGHAGALHLLDHAPVPE